MAGNTRMSRRKKVTPNEPVIAPPPEQPTPEQVQPEAVEEKQVPRIWMFSDDGGATWTEAHEADVPEMEEPHGLPEPGSLIDG